jgi:hypothetical protein
MTSISKESTRNHVAIELAIPFRPFCSQISSERKGSGISFHGVRIGSKSASFHPSFSPMYSSKKAFACPECLFTLFTSYYVPLLRRGQLYFENLSPLIVVSLFSCITSLMALPCLRYQTSLLVVKAPFVTSLRKLQRQSYSI